MHDITLAGQCEKGVSYNWSQYLCQEFLDNVREAQEEGKKFNYSWLLLLIALVAWEMLEGAVLPEVESGVCEGARYANLWDSPYPQRVKENKIFWVLFEGALAAVIHLQPRLSSTIYTKYRAITNF